MWQSLGRSFRLAMRAGQVNLELTRGGVRGPAGGEEPAGEETQMKKRKKEKKEQEGLIPQI